MSALDDYLEGKVQKSRILRDDAIDDLAQLRADLQAAQERIAWLTSDIGESGLAAINRLIAACERGDIAQQAAPDLNMARYEIVRQARQIDEARIILDNIFKHDWSNRKILTKAQDWLAANPAPQEPQPPNGEGGP